jgi:hypothetical protein
VGCVSQFTERCGERSGACAAHAEDKDAHWFFADPGVAVDEAVRHGVVELLCLFFVCIWERDLVIGR